MVNKSKPKVNKEQLDKKAKKDPKSRKWNNANSRKNLKQYQKDEDALTPEIMKDTDEFSDVDTQEIVRGRKLSPQLVKKLIPKRGVFTIAERKRFKDIVIQYLSDFKNEEPTAADVDDIFEIAKSDVLEMRLLEASRADAGVLVHVNQAIEKIYKRKQTAKENLSARRSDRKEIRMGQGITIIDLVVDYDNTLKEQQKQKLDALFHEEKETEERLRKVLEEDGY